MSGRSTPITCTSPDAAGATRAPAISVVVPVFDNAGSLEALNARLTGTLGGLGEPFEIVYVNDGSRDDSFVVLRDIARAEPRVVVADLERNVGQSAAVMAGFALARGRTLVTIDADLENRPEDIPSLLAAVAGGADLACGVRTRRDVPLLTRRVPSWIANRLVGYALGVRLRDWGCGLNAVTGEVVRKMLTARPLPRLPKIEAAMLASRVDLVEVGHGEREHGRSGYTLARLAGFALEFLESFAIGRTLRKLFRGPTEVRDTDGRVRARPAPIRIVEAIVASICWTTLSLLAIFARALSAARPGRRPGPAQVRELLAQGRSLENESRA